MSTSSPRATPAPIHRVALVATFSIVAAAALIAWQPSSPSSQPLYSSDAPTSSKEFRTPNIRVAANGAANLWTAAGAERVSFP